MARPAKQIFFCGHQHKIDQHRQRTVRQQKPLSIADLIVKSPPNMKLTTDIARNLEPPSGKTDHFYWDEEFPGFGVRVRAGRNRVKRMWVYQSDIAGRTRRITLGHVNAIGIQQARKAAGELSAKVRLGDDPVREKAEKLERAANTFATVMETYLAAAKLEQRASTWETTEHHLKVHCKPLHPLPFTTITRRDIAAVLAPITARGTLMHSNNVRAKLSALFNWAIGEGLIENNPVLGTKKHEGKDRERVLSLPELTAIWYALDDIPSSVHNMTDYTAIVRLLMLTGQRRSEIGNLRRREVRDEDFIEDGAVITGPAIVLPPERTKNGRKHIVPLSKPAQTILLTRPRGPDDRFVLRRSKSTVSSWWLRKKSLNDALIKRGHKLEPWVLHDLRRSVATGMGEIGILPHVIEAVLNHISGTRAGIAGVYNKSKLEKAKRQAIEAWTEVLMAHVEGREVSDKVVPLRA
jgi:integrase